MSEVEINLKGMADDDIGLLSDEAFESGLRKTYKINKDTPDSVFLYVSGNDRKFPVKSKKNGKWVLNKRLVNAALKRFHQTSPTVQSAIKGRLSRLARKFGFNPPGESKKEETPIAPGKVRVDASFEAALKDIESAFEKM